MVHEKGSDVGRVDFCALFREADGREEVARVHLQVVVQNDQRALLLQSPDFLIELGVFDREKLLVHAVVGEEGHVVVWRLNDAWCA